jgi:hypothetical protein
LALFRTIAPRPTRKLRPTRPRWEIGFVWHVSPPGAANWLCLYGRLPVACRPRLALFYTSHFALQTSPNWVCLYNTARPASPGRAQPAPDRKLGLLPERHRATRRCRTLGSGQLALFVQPALQAPGGGPQAFLNPQSAIEQLALFRRSPVHV